MQVSVVISRSSTSLGDALRAIDSKGCIGSDFVLISGNTMTNMDLRVPLAEHKARREKDRNAIMTLVTPTSHLGHIIFRSALAISSPSASNPVKICRAFLQTVACWD